MNINSINALGLSDINNNIAEKISGGAFRATIKARGSERRTVDLGENGLLTGNVQKGTIVKIKNVSGRSRKYALRLLAPDGSEKNRDGILQPGEKRSISTKRNLGSRFTVGSADSAFL